MRKRKELGQSSDIAFLLIIFFLLLSGVTASHSLDLQIPKTSVLVGDAEETIAITLKQDGSIIYHERILQTSELPSVLNQKPHLTLAIESKTDWQTVVSLLSMLEQYPLGSLSLEVLP